MITFYRFVEHLPSTRSKPSWKTILNTFEYYLPAAGAECCVKTTNVLRRKILTKNEYAHTLDRDVANAYACLDGTLAKLNENEKLTTKA